MAIDTVAGKKRAAEVLLVEDDFADAVLAKKAFSEVADVSCNVTVAKDGETAIELLRGGTCCDLIMLDLNLPGISGVDLLREVKSDKKLWRIPVIVLTTSRAEKDVSACYDLLANCYVVKPIDYPTFKKFVDVLAHFWFVCAISPHE